MLWDDSLLVEAGESWDETCGSLFLDAGEEEFSDGEFDSPVGLRVGDSKNWNLIFGLLWVELTGEWDLFSLRLAESISAESVDWTDDCVDSLLVSL